MKTFLRILGLAGFLVGSIMIAWLLVRLVLGPGPSVN